MNGPPYWEWRWQRLPAHKVYFGMLMAGLPFFLAQLIYIKRKNFLIMSICLVSLSTVMMQLAGISMYSEGFQLDRIGEIVLNPLVTSYYTDAARLSWQISIGQLLSEFPVHLPNFIDHSLTKPPGPILYYYLLIKLFGINQSTAFIGGFVIIIISSFVVPAAFWLLRCFGENREVSFLGASYMTLCPGLILFSPEFDQIYPIFTCLLLGSWVLALQKDSLLFSSFFGGVLFLLSFMAYNLLTLGAFIAFYGIYYCLIKNERKLGLLIKHSFIGIFVVLITYYCGWILLGFDPIETFIVCLNNFKNFDSSHFSQRTYLMSILFSLLDFSLGLGWIPVFLTVTYLFSKLQFDSGRSLPIIIIGLLQILIAAISGLLPGETARIGIFMMPFLMLPVGVMLSSWGVLQRNILYFFAIMLISAIGQNMLFINV
jgi:hypothetical protein